MKINFDKNRVGLVRVVLGIADRYSGSVSTDYEDCEKKGNVRAVGFWHSHDENNLEFRLGEDADLILKAYSKMSGFSGAIITTEWKDYEG